MRCHLFWSLLLTIVSASPHALCAEEGLAIDVIVPEDAPTRAAVNSGAYEIKVRMQNNTKELMILWPYLSVELLDADDEPVPPVRNIGRWGFIATPSILEGIPFAALKPGEKRTIAVVLSGYQWDADRIVGWRVSRDSNYRVLMTYEYDRAAVVEKYGRGCKRPDAPEQPWNRARPAKWMQEIELKVK